MYTGEGVLVHLPYLCGSTIWLVDRIEVFATLSMGMKSFPCHCGKNKGGKRSQGVGKGWSGRVGTGRFDWRAEKVTACLRDGPFLPLWGPCADRIGSHLI